MNIRNSTLSWDDIRLTLACVRAGNFTNAAKSLGMDQATVSRRISAVEEILGRPLFERRRSGAKVTKFGEFVYEEASSVEKQMNSLFRTLSQYGAKHEAQVVLAVSHGMVHYVLGPVLYNSGPSPLTLPDDVLTRLPSIVYVEPESPDADIFLTVLHPDHAPAGSTAMRGRRIGMMRMVPWANREYEAELRKNGNYPKILGDLIGHRILDLTFYHWLPGLTHWADMVSKIPGGAAATFSTTNTLHANLVTQRAISLLPTYSSLYESEIVPLDMVYPEMGFGMWVLSHEDRLREPNVRFLFDTISQMFLSSKWFR